MTTPRYTELAKKLHAFESDPSLSEYERVLCSDATTALRHAADLEREVAELRERLAGAEADAAELAEVLRFIFRYPNNWYLPRAQRALDVHRSRLAAHTSPTIDPTGAET